MTPYNTGIYRLGEDSLDHLSTCHPLLKMVVRHAITMTPMDFSVVWGFRGARAQNKAFDDGNSSLKWPHSEHNHLSDAQDVAEGFAEDEGLPLSLATDVVPYLFGKQQWNRPREANWLNGWICGVGMPLVMPHGFYLRSGSDWDMDGDQAEHTLKDPYHVELRRLP